MGVESAADQAAFFNTDEFAVVAVLSRMGALPQEIQGLFSSETMPMLGGYDGPIMGLSTSFLVNSNEAELVQNGDELFVNKTHYTVGKIETNTDGGGMVRLILEVADG